MHRKKILIFVAKSWRTNQYFPRNIAKKNCFKGLGDYKRILLNKN